jgi:hypothetical protein
VHSANGRLRRVARYRARFNGQRRIGALSDLSRVFDIDRVLGAPRGDHKAGQDVQ